MIYLSKRKCIYFAVILFAMIVSSILIGILPLKSVASLKTAILIQFFGFVLMFGALGYMNNALITLYSVFMVVFYIFQNGQLFLYAINMDIDLWAIRTFSVKRLQQSVFFSNLCMYSAFAAAVFSADRKKNWIAKKIDLIAAQDIYKIAFAGFFATGVIAYGLIAIKLLVWLGGGYSGVMVFERNVPSIVGLIEALFPAFCILLIISGVKSGYRVTMAVLAFAGWGLVTALIGDRTTGIGVIVVMLLMHYYGCVTFSVKKNRFAFYIGCILVFCLIAFAAQFRNHSQYSFGSLFKIVLDVIYELGFSFFPLAAMMSMCPNSHGYLYGESMISSAISGFIPESLDLLGLFSGMADKASIPLHWIEERYQYGFGTDCSLNAEVYANFGVFGFLAMFVICSIIASMLKATDYESDQNIYSQYIGFVLLFGWFTLPRRRSYYIYNKIFWYVIVVGAFIGLMYSISQKRGEHAKSE